MESKKTIFVFSGTGNSLWTAKKVAQEVEDCEIAAMGRNWKGPLPENFDVIGFVYPTYGRGIPGQVGRFIEQLDLSHHRDAYFFAIATCGGTARAKNAIPQVQRILLRKGIKHFYGARLEMASNYIISYSLDDNMRAGKTKQAKVDIQPIIEAIKRRTVNPKNIKLNLRQQLAYLAFMRYGVKADYHYTVSDACIQCAVCKKVCPVANIEMEESSSPYFLHHCEQCLACLNHCPTKAINYKNKTQDKERYRHPCISWRELAALNGFKE